MVCWAFVPVSVHSAASTAYMLSSRTSVRSPVPVPGPLVPKYEIAYRSCREPVFDTVSGTKVDEPGARFCGSKANCVGLPRTRFTLPVWMAAVVESSSVKMAEVVSVVAPIAASPTMTTVVQRRRRRAASRGTGGGLIISLSRSSIMSAPSRGHRPKLSYRHPAAGLEGNAELSPDRVLRAWWTRWTGVPGGRRALVLRDGSARCPAAATAPRTGYCDDEREVVGRDGVRVEEALRLVDAEPQQDL